MVGRFHRNIREAECFQSCDEFRAVGKPSVSTNAN
jgi:hypothetical protein